MKKKILSIVVTVLMAFAMMPITAEKAYAESYPLYVDGVQVTDENCSSIATTSEGTVTASFDPGTLTLTLDNFNSSKNIYCPSYMGDITINLIGKNNISTDDGIGISFPNNLVIQDDPSDEDVGELTVEAKGNGILRGIAVSGNLTISKCKLTATSNESETTSSYGIRTELGGEISIEDGTVIATAGKASPNSSGSYGIAAFGQGGQLITIKGTSEVIASGYTEAFSGPVINEISGKGWTDINGTEGEEKIDISDTERGLRNHNDEYFRKVHFKKLPLLTITAKDQTYEYDGEMHGPGDTAYADPAEIAEVVTVDGLQGNDELTGIQVDGQGQEIGTYELMPSGALINNDADAIDNYDVTYVPGKLTIKGQKPEPQPTPTPTPAKISGTLLSKMTAKGKRSLVLKWNKIDGVDGYDVFFSRCNNNGRETSCKKVKTIKGNDTFKWTKSRLSKGKAYKAYVKAYVMKDGKKSYVKTSPTIHAYTSGGNKNYTNAKSVTVKNKKVSLKKGKTYKIKASVNKLDESKKLMPSWHAPKLRYVSSNKKVVTVSKTGKITVKGKGKCKVYVIAVNGVRKAVSITVN